jgi:hypothetical protein
MGRLKGWQYALAWASVEAAIADAIWYNDLCSLEKGLQTLTQSLITAGNPSLDEFYTAVQKYNKIKAAMMNEPSAAPSAAANPAETPPQERLRHRARH